MLDIDRLAYQSRWLQVSPTVKFILYLCLLCLALFSTPKVQILTLVILMPVTCYVGRLRLISYVRWMMIPFSFLLISVLGIALSVSWGSEVMLYSVSIAGLHIGFSIDSFSMANVAFWRSLCALAATYLFVFTTPFIQLIAILKRCHLPKLLIEQILLIYRFIFIFIEESAAIYRAQSLRFGYDSLRGSLHSLSMLVSMLLERVLLRHQQMTVALDIKLYRGEFYY